MQSPDPIYLADILQAAEQISSFLHGVGKGSFAASDLLQSAVVWQIEIIGKAAKRLSEETRLAHPEIPWGKLAGMGDILVHAYDDVDVSDVWSTAIIAIPDVARKINAMMQPET